MIKRIWNDAVGSKVIAWAIQLCLAAVFAPPLYWTWKTFGGWQAILLTVGVVAVFILLWDVRNRNTPRIEQVGDVDVTFDEGAVFRLKCWVRLRNDAAKCADVQIINYMQKMVNLRFVTNVLQLNVGNDWYPPTGKPGADRLPVLPGQLFQAWVGVDERRHSKNEVQALRGQIGTLIFRVNGKRLNVDI
jgi:hypothetical protein